MIILFNYSTREPFLWKRFRWYRGNCGGNLSIGFKWGMGESECCTRGSKSVTLSLFMPSWCVDCRPPGVRLLCWRSCASSIQSLTMRRVFTVMYRLDVQVLGSWRWCNDTVFNSSNIWLQYCVCLAQFDYSTVYDACVKFDYRSWCCLSTLGHAALNK